MNREPTLDELIGADTTGAERQRLQHVHELLLEAGPPPEVSPELEQGPNLKMTVGKRRRVVRQRALLLLAASLAVLLVFLGGYAVGNQKGSTKSATAVSLKLMGTSAVPNAQASLEVWHRHAGNWPMTLTAMTKIGYAGPWVFELPDHGDAERVLKGAVGARRRIQAILDDSAQPFDFSEPA